MRVGGFLRKYANKYFVVCIGFAQILAGEVCLHKISKFCTKTGASNLLINNPVMHDEYLRAITCYSGGFHMPVFQLFKMRLVQRRDGTLFDGEIDRVSILSKAVESLPTLQVRRGYLWRLGSVRKIGNSDYYFAIGRTHSQTVGQFDEEAGEFIEQELQESPFTHVVLDTNMQLVAISANYSLEPTIKGLADRLGPLLERAQNVSEFGYLTIEIDPVKDPVEFLAYISDAYRIMELTTTFSRPNAWDYSEHFHKPLSATLDFVDGEEGQAKIKGVSLNKKNLKEVVRSGAANGDDISAKLVANEGEKATRKRLGENHIIFEEEDPKDDEARRKLLSVIRQLYEKVRKGSEE